MNNTTATTTIYLVCQKCACENADASLRSGAIVVHDEVRYVGEQKDEWGDTAHCEVCSLRPATFEADVTYV